MFSWGYLLHMSITMENTPLQFSNFVDTRTRQMLWHISWNMDENMLNVLIFVYIYIHLLRIYCIIPYYVLKNNIVEIYYNFLVIIKVWLTQNPQKTFDDNTNRLQVGKSMSIVTPCRRRKGGYSYRRPNHILPANNNVIPITMCPTET